MFVVSYHKQYFFKKLEVEDSPGFWGLYSRACNSKMIQVVMIQASDVVEKFGTLATKVVMWVVLATNFENASVERS